MTATPSLPLPRPTGAVVGAPPLQGALALDFPLPSGLPALPQTPELALVVAGTPPPTDPAGASTGPIGPQPCSGPPVTCPVPAAREWAGRFVQAVVEVIAGDRPLQQLIRWTDERVYSDLSRRVRILGLTTSAASRHRIERSHVRSVHIYQPHPRAAEVAAHVRHGARSRAVAARLEAERGRWTCTALRLG